MTDEHRAMIFGPAFGAALAVLLVLALAGCSGARDALPDRETRCAAYAALYTAAAVGRDTHNAEQASRLRIYETFLTSFCGGLPELGGEVSAPG